jgi:hypothetical protein
MCCTAGRGRLGCMTETVEERRRLAKEEQDRRFAAERERERLAAEERERGSAAREIEIRASWMALALMATFALFFVMCREYEYERQDSLERRRRIEAAEARSSRDAVPTPTGPASTAPPSSTDVTTTTAPLRRRELPPPPVDDAWGAEAAEPTATTATTATASTVARPATTVPRQPSPTLPVGGALPAAPTPAVTVPSTSGGSPAPAAPDEPTPATTSPVVTAPTTAPVTAPPPTTAPPVTTAAPVPTTTAPPPVGGVLRDVSVTCPAPGVLLVRGFDVPGGEVTVYGPVRSNLGTADAAGAFAITTPDQPALPRPFELPMSSRTSASYAAVQVGCGGT